MIRLLKPGLSIRLFIFIYAIMVISFAFNTTNILRRHRKDLMDSVEMHSFRISDCIQRSTRYGMMLNKKDDVQSILVNLGNEPGVAAIHVYNKNGEIKYSTDPEVIDEQIQLNNEACIQCHDVERALPAKNNKNQMRIIERDGERLLAVSNLIPNEESCYNAPCHAHSSSDKILGVMDVQMSLAMVDEHIQQSRKGIVANAIYSILAVAFLFGIFIYFTVRERVKRLIVGTQQVASGNLDYQIDIRGYDEISRLARSFNKMTVDLKNARHEITEWSTSLEKKVDQKTKDLEKAQQHLIRMEKLASLGKLSAVVAHEINNPLAGSLSYTMLVLRMLDEKELTEERKLSILRYLGFVKDEISRVGDIIKNMLIFAKQTGGDFSHEHIKPLVDSAIMLVKHQLSIKGIKLINDFNCTQDVCICDAGQIRQALVALFINAIEAMEGGGELSIKTECSEQKITLTVKDTGLGIPEENLKNIFDPFFSTKKEGKGVGLGLSVVYGIIQRHKGNITVESKESMGTAVTIQLPREPEIDTEVKITPDLSSK